MTTVACEDCEWDGAVDGWTYVGRVKGADRCCSCGAEVDCYVGEDLQIGSVYTKDRDATPEEIRRLEPLRAILAPEVLAVLDRESKGET